MNAKPPLPPGFRAAIWGLGIAVLGMGLALVATVDMFQRERAAGERMRMASQPLIDSLRAEIGRSRGAAARSGASGSIEGISRTDIDRLRQSGLADPIPDLKADLARHPELIPVKGDLGGTMGFYHPDQIWILNRRWACAYFEDGHVGGWMLLEFRVEGGSISWRRIETIDL